MRIGFERLALHLFDGLLDQPAADRDRWLEDAASGDAELVRAVRALAAADQRSASLPTLPPAEDQPAEPPPPPETLGKYRLVRELGHGGMGVVYLAERDDGLFEQQVAVKLLRYQVAGRSAAAFEAERRLLARVEHANVARLIDGGVAPDGRPWLATEYVSGITIEAAGALRPLRGRVKLLLQAAQAVQFAHGRLVAHGDIKPANILVGEDGRVKLLDFGVARLTGSDVLERSGAFTPGFASPERVGGAPPSVADDVFALGQTLAAVVGAEGDRELAAMTARATAPEPARYGTAQALIDDLERWLDRQPVAAMNGGALYRARKFAARNRVGVVVSLLAVAGLIGAALIAEHNYLRAERARAAAALRFADAHRTAHYLMFTLLDRLERQPGTLRLRMQVGAVAQRYLDRLAASPDAARDVRLDVAQGYLRAAATTGMGNQPNFGDVDRAERDLLQAKRMLDVLRREEPHWPALATPIAQTASLLCQNQIYGRGHDARRALVIAREGLAELTDLIPDPGARAAAVWPVRICAGDALVWLNRAPAAVTLLERELAAGRQRRPFDEVMLERNLRVLGEAYYYASRFPDAERALGEAAAIQAAAHARQPLYGAAVNEAANVADDLASTYQVERRYADQLRVAQAALDMVRRQAANDPDDVQSLRRALSMTRLVADAQAHLGHPDVGAALMVRAGADWAALARRFANDATTARLRLLALGVTADLQQRAGDGAAACGTYRVAADGWVRFGRAWHLSPSDTTENVDPLRRNLAACARQAPERAGGGMTAR